MKQLHPIQIDILKKLLFSKSLKFSEIKPNLDMDNNQFDFHLDSLIKHSYIEKKDKQYSLTNFGKEYANRIDENQNAIKQQAKIGVMLGVLRGDIQKEYLVFTRLKHPFFGCQGFITGKVTYGESIIETATREFKEETNLIGVPQLVGIKHFRVYNKISKELLEDKFMYLCRIENPTGELIGNEEGKFEWVKESELENYITTPFETIEILMKDIEEIKYIKSNLSFVETECYSDKF